MSCDVVTVREDIGVDEAARLIVSGSFDHLPVISKDGRLIGIITTWDISKAVAGGKPSCIGEIMKPGSGFIPSGLTSPLRLPPAHLMCTAYLPCLWLTGTTR